MKQRAVNAQKGDLNRKLESETEREREREREREKDTPRKKLSANLSARLGADRKPGNRNQ